MKDARKKVLAALKPLMTERGYRFLSTSNEFRRSEGEFTYQWQTRFLRGSDGVEVDPEIGIRSEVIERIFHRTSTYPPNHQAGTSTIGASLANVEGVPLTTYRCRVTTDNDVQATVEKLLVLFDSKAIPYFKRNGNIEAIDHLLNDRPSEHTPHCAYGLPRETRGLIAAKLVARPNYQELVAFYRSRIAKLNSGFYVPQFEALVALLESMKEPRKEYEEGSGLA